MSSAGCRDASTEYRLTALPGYRAAYVLATWGLVSLLPGATLRFEGEGVPVVGYGGDTDELVNVAACSLAERTWKLGDHGLRGIATTTPTRSAVNVLSHVGWQAAEKTSDLSASGPVAVFDTSATSADQSKMTRTQDLQVRSSALPLLSGRSHTAKSVQDTWGLMGESLTTADDAVAAAAASTDLCAATLPLPGPSRGCASLPARRPRVLPVDPRSAMCTRSWISWPSAGTCSSSRSSEK